jgi:hypothetical protein
LKKSKTKDQNENSIQIEGSSLNLTCFGTSFHLNKTTRFLKNSAVSFIFTEKKGKKQKQCRFERHHMSSSFPGHADAGEGAAFPCVLLLSLSLPQSPKAPPLA